MIISEVALRSLIISRKPAPAVRVRFLRLERKPCESVVVVVVEVVVLIMSSK